MQERHDGSGVSRREALKILGAGVVWAGLAGSAAAETAPGTAKLGWDLPKLGFEYGALEPHLDARTMEIHHTKHHQAYITNARKLLEPHPTLLERGPEALIRDLDALPEEIRTGIRNNAGGHVNHAFFWRLLSPNGRREPRALGLTNAIVATFGSFAEFKAQFADAAAKRFGSGWAWLSVKDGKLLVHSTANQDSPLMEGMTPVLGLDVWEHAYYLHYQNRRADYIAAFWNAVDWAVVEKNYARITLRGEEA